MFRKISTGGGLEWLLAREGTEIYVWYDHGYFMWDWGVKGWVPDDDEADYGEGGYVPYLFEVSLEDPSSSRNFRRPRHDGESVRHAECTSICKHDNFHIIDPISLSIYVVATPLRNIAGRALIAIPLRNLAGRAQVLCCCHIIDAI